jgi:hypothetical protein
VALALEKGAVRHEAITPKETFTEEAVAVAGTAAGEDRHEVTVTPKETFTEEAVAVAGTAAGEDRHEVTEAPRAGRNRAGGVRPVAIVSKASGEHKHEANKTPRAGGDRAGGIRLLVLQRPELDPRAEDDPGAPSGTAGEADIHGSGAQQECGTDHRAENDPGARTDTGDEAGTGGNGAQQECGALASTSTNGKGTIAASEGEQENCPAIAAEIAAEVAKQDHPNVVGRLERGPDDSAARLVPHHGAAVGGEKVKSDEHHDGDSGGTGLDECCFGAHEQQHRDSPWAATGGGGNDTAAEMYYIGEAAESCAAMHDIIGSMAESNIGKSKRLYGRCEELRDKVAAAMVRVSTGPATHRHETFLMMEKTHVEEIADELIAVVLNELYAVELRAVKAEEAATGSEGDAGDPMPSAASRGDVVDQGERHEHAVQRLGGAARRLFRRGRGCAAAVRRLRWSSKLSRRPLVVAVGGTLRIEGPRRCRARCVEF